MESADMGWKPSTIYDFLFEIELEDMCEEDPSTWEELANERWVEATWPAEETRDSTSGELLDPKKVHEGCQEELGFMSQMGVWDKVTREKAKNDPEGKIVGTRWVFVKQTAKRSDADLSPNNLLGVTSERTYMPAPRRSLPPDTFSLTVCREKRAAIPIMVAAVDQLEI